MPGYQVTADPGRRTAGFRPSGRTQTYSMKSLFFGEATEVIRGGRIDWVDATNTLEELRIATQDMREIAIVPTIVDDLDENCSGHLVGLHQFQKHLDGCIFARWNCTIGKWKRRVVLPDVNMRVDDNRAGATP